MEIKNIIHGIVLMVMMGCANNNQQLSTAEIQRVETEVRQAFDELVAAANDLDIERYFGFFNHEKFIGLNADGTVWHSVEDLKKLIEPGFSSTVKIESLEFSQVRISVIDSNTAVLVNEFSQVMELQNGYEVTSQGGGAQVWSKSTGQWQLVSVSASNKSAD